MIEQYLGLSSDLLSLSLPFGLRRFFTLNNSQLQVSLNIIVKSAETVTDSK